MYLNTPLDQLKYMRMHCRDAPQEIIDEYKLQKKIGPDGYIYMEIRKAIYGLKQAGKLANKQLEKVLATRDYYPSQYTTGLYLHKTRPISFTLVVDNFGVKYFNKAGALYLKKTHSRTTTP